MNRQEYFNGIQSRLSWLVSSVELRGGLNILDINILSEDFFAHFLNHIYGWNLGNMNVAKQNVAGLDLIDDVHKIIVQVSSVISKQKIDSSLSKIDLTRHSGYNFKFIGITNDAEKLREKTYLTPSAISFNPKADIFDIGMIIKHINNEDIDKIKEIYEFIQKEIKMPISQEKLETNIAKIIGIISQTELKEVSKPETIPFEIERKIEFNQLVKSKAIIDNYKYYYASLDRIYTEFDKLGNNKSLSVLNKLKSIYITKSENENPDECFQQIIDDVIGFVKQSSNYEPLSEEELLMYVGIIVVDAFIRCKIFKNPEEA
jgi:hypothetical protein